MRDAKVGYRAPIIRFIAYVCVRLPLFCVAQFSTRRLMCITSSSNILGPSTRESIAGRQIESVRLLGGAASLLVDFLQQRLHMTVI